MTRLAVLALATLSAAACARKSSGTARPVSTPPPGGGGGSMPANPNTGTTGAMGNAEDPCPAIQIKAPDSVPQGTKARVSANLIGGAGRPIFNWSLTAGTIASGQGTPMIQVDTTGLGGSGVSVTLDLRGLPSQCATTSASASFLVGN